MAKLNRNIIEKKVGMATDNMIAYAKQLIEEGKKRELVISNPKGKIELKLPLIKGTAIGSVATIVAPFLTLVGGIAVLATHHTIEIREKKPNGSKK